VADKEVLIKEFEAIQVRYRELMAQLVSMKIPAVLDASAGACDTGEWCCTGTESVDPRLARVYPVEQLRTRR